MTCFTLLPAVDIAGGLAEQVAGPGSRDPLTVAQAWVAAGATWVHVVDLDRARGHGHNVDVIADLVARLTVPVQVSGGVADEDSLQQALATGASRVNLASTALLDLPWVRDAVARHGERVTVGIDVRGQDVVARGVDTRIGALDDVLLALREIPVRTFVVADGSRDGSREGADVAMFTRLARSLRAPVIASGGVATLADLRALRGLQTSGVRGVVLGAALYQGAFTFEQALVTVRPGDEGSGDEEGTG